MLIVLYLYVLSKRVRCVNGGTGISLHIVYYYVTEKFIKASLNIKRRTEVGKDITYKPMVSCKAFYKKAFLLWYMVAQTAQKTGGNNNG